MRIFGFRFGVGKTFARRRTAFLLCLFLGLVCSMWAPGRVTRANAVYVYLTPHQASWVDQDGMRFPVSNCGLLTLTLDDDGAVKLNHERFGTIEDLTELREFLEAIIEERRQKVVIVDLGPDGFKEFGIRIVNAEFMVRPAASSKYADFVRLVDLAFSFAPSVVYVETPSYSKESETEFERWTYQFQKNRGG